MMANSQSVCRDCRLSELLGGYARIPSGLDRPVRKLRLDSRCVDAGDVFFAMPGSRSDGRDYIDQAVEQRAAAVVYEKAGARDTPDRVSDTPLLAIEGLRDALGHIASRFFGFPSRRTRVIGVTGTNGKTTVAYLVAQTLEHLGMPCAYLGTIGSGRVGALRHSDLTTTDSITLQSALADAVEGEIPAVAMEVSSHGLDQGRVNGVEFQIGIFTNLTRDHLDYHGTMQQYGLAKRKLFECPSLAAVVVNTDDAFGREIVRFCRANASIRCFTYGLDDSAQLCPDNVELRHDGMSFDLDIGGSRIRLESTLIGRVNLGNLLAAVGALLAFGIPPVRIAEAFREMRPPPGRMDLLRGRGESPAVVVDFAHSPDALEHALSSLRELCRGNLVAVFGCGGERDPGKRPAMGTVAERHADSVILTSDNPRGEPPERIIADIARGMRLAPKICPDREAAIRLAIESSGRDDMVLVAGKGHERQQIVGDEVLDFDDRERVLKLLGTVS